MNIRNRVVTTLAAVVIGGALGTALVSRLPGELPGRVSDRSKVCMVNDKVLAQAQLPVVVSGKTYYGCCAGCVDRLNKDRKARVAVDPVSGRDIDKSEAVIIQGARGQALYFESTETARRYQARAS